MTGTFLSATALFWKDVREQRTLLYLLLGFAIAMPLVGVSFTGELERLPLLTTARNILLYILTARLIRANPPPQVENASAQSKAIKSIFVEKALFVGSLPVLVWIIREAIVARVGIQMTFPDHFQLLVDTFTDIGSRLAIVCLCALFIRRVWLVVLVYFVIFVLCLDVLSPVFERLWGKMGSPGSFDPYSMLLLQCRNLVLEWLVIATVLITACLRYTTGKVLLPLAVGVFGMLFGLAFTPIWPFNFAPRPVDAVSSDRFNKAAIVLNAASGQSPLYESNYWPSSDTSVVYLKYFEKRM